MQLTTQANHVRAAATRVFQQPARSFARSGCAYPTRAQATLKSRQVEQQLAAGLGERQIAALVEEDEIEPALLVGDEAGLADVG